METTESDAERFVFGKLNTELSDDWIVLHSLGLTVHNRKPWAEIDFVLIGPPGVYCLEIKGGAIARNGRVWTTTSKAGVTHELKESPFSQVGSATAALHGFLTSNVRNFGGTVTGYGVAFPDVEFRYSGPDIEAEMIYDARDVYKPFSDYVQRLVEYWRNRCRRDWGREPGKLTQALRVSVRDALARDFDLCVSLRAELGAVNDELVRLTEEQCRTVSGLAENPRVIVTGGAGTGKTLLASAELKRLGADGRRVLYLCFNRHLAVFMREQFAGHKNVTIHHLHGLMAEVVKNAKLEDQLPDAESTDLMEVFYPELCLGALLDGERLPYDALIIDEAQDLLLGSYLDVVEALTKDGIKGIWRMFLDPNQNIYAGTASNALSRLESVSPARFKLRINCRNTIAIATATSLLSGIRADSVQIVDGPPVKFNWYEDGDSERRLVSECVSGLLHRGLKPQEIMILSPYRLENSCMRRGLVGAPVPVREFGDESRERMPAVRFSTVAAFKGLEADAVLLIDIDDLEIARSLLTIYVGTSRAKVILHLFLHEGQRKAYDESAFRFGRMTLELMTP
ncbi:MAG: AAA family ATPase [Planctomycetota bacterium]